MERFRVALSGDFLRRDGKPAFPDFDLSPLRDDPRIDYGYLSTTGVVRAEDVMGFDALILMGSAFRRDSVPPDRRLALIARFGVGFDNVDLDACTENGIALTTAPDGVRRPVAVAILTLMLALTGRIMRKDRLARAGADAWAERKDAMGVGLVGRTLGSIGVGNIGAEMFRLARAFDLRFIAHDPHVDPAVPKSLDVAMVSLDRLFQESDVLAVNCPLTPSTRGLVDAKRLAQMKPTAFLINTARGPIVDQTALTAALEGERLAGAGLDVFTEEPAAWDDPLLRLDNVIVTPHSLAWTDQCFAGIGAADIKAVLEIMQGRAPAGIINDPVLENAELRAKLESYRGRFGNG